MEKQDIEKFNTINQNLMVLNVALGLRQILVLLNMLYQPWVEFKTSLVFLCCLFFLKIELKLMEVLRKWR